MARRVGRYTVELETHPSIIGSAAVVGKSEGEGPLASEFDFIFEDETLGQASFEKAESTLQNEAVTRALTKSGKTADDIDYILAGDLLSQCIGTTFSLRSLGIPFLGLYGACSTMALSLGLASLLVDTGIANTTVAATSSHFCSAERQFRLPLEYGGQRTPTSQRTATAAGASVISSMVAGKPCIEAVTFGKITDLGIKDANNMGAAMAPAAAGTIAEFLKDTNTSPSDYDYIVTGDLGLVGSDLLCKLMIKDYDMDIKANHVDCGLLLYDLEKQDMHAGGSGCGCSACVLNSYFMRKLTLKEVNKILFVATGALMSPLSCQQGESIPSIAHAVLLSSPKA